MPSASPKRAKKSSSRASSPRKTSPRSTGGVSLSSTNLMRSMSPSASTRSATKRKVACTEGRDGKLKCVTVDANQMPVSDAAKAIIAKKVTACQKLEDQGFGACDAEGNFWGYQDEMPQGYHEEIDENGNIIRSVILEPKNIFVLGKNSLKDLDKIRSMMLDSGEKHETLGTFLAMAGLGVGAAPAGVDRAKLIEFYNNNSISGSKQLKDFFGDLELKLVNPDKLKTVFMVTKDEVINRNKLMRYLVCLAADDEEGANATRFGYVGSSVAAFAKSILKFNFIKKVLDFIQRPEVKEAVKDKGGVIGHMKELNISSDMMLIQGDDLIFERIKWNYDGLRSVSVKIPEQLAAKIGEKLAFNELINLIDNFDSTEDGKSKFKVWLKRLIQNGNILGSELSGTLVASLIIQGGFDYGDLGLTEEYCLPLLNSARENKTFTLETDDKGEVKSVLTKNANNQGLLRQFLFNDKTGLRSVVTDKDAKRILQIFLGSVFGFYAAREAVKTYLRGRQITIAAAINFDIARLDAAAATAGNAAAKAAAYTAVAPVLVAAVQANSPTDVAYVNMRQEALKAALGAIAAWPDDVKGVLTAEFTRVIDVNAAGAAAGAAAVGGVNSLNSVAGPGANTEFQNVLAEYEKFNGTNFAYVPVSIGEYSNLFGSIRNRVLSPLRAILPNEETIDVYAGTANATGFDALRTFANYVAAVLENTDGMSVVPAPPNVRTAKPKFDTIRAQAAAVSGQISALTAYNANPVTLFANFKP